MNPARLLDNDLLDRLDRVLARQPGDLLARIGPPTSEEAVRRLFADLEVAPTDEVVRWLARHEWNSTHVLPGIEALSAETAALGYAGIRALAEELSNNAGQDGLTEWTPELYWSPDWLLIFGLAGLYKLAVDCGGTPDGPSPIRMVAWDGVGEPHYAAAFVPSLGQYIQDACDVLETGRYTYDPDRDAWSPMDYANHPIVEGFAGLLKRD